MTELSEGSEKTAPRADAHPAARTAAALDAQLGRDRPRIVVLCGSARFYDHFQEANHRLTTAGKIVLSIGFPPAAAEHEHENEHGHGHGHSEGTGHVDGARHDDARYDDARHGATRHDDARHDDARHDDARHGATRHDDARHDDAGHDDAGHDDTGPGEGVGPGSAAKAALDDLHKRKIDLADEAHVLNVHGYIGQSTRSEINYAEAAGKPITYMEPT
ncbi:hypothetical protein AB0C07_07735 [Actinoplanes missouriensis]|uniref:hypothetical protein n=1 Tax=Actinoplanes missouriensis TaxID=1866 RepID=UPI0033F7F390